MCQRITKFHTTFVHLPDSVSLSELEVDSVVSVSVAFFFILGQTRVRFMADDRWLSVGGWLGGGGFMALSGYRSSLSHSTIEESIGHIKRPLWIRFSQTP